MQQSEKTHQSFTLSDGRQIGHAEFGDPTGFPIIYCHGSQSSRLEMHYDLSFARTHKLRIITVDRPGHGISDFNPKGNILTFAQDVKALTEHLDIKRSRLPACQRAPPLLSASPICCLRTFTKWQ